ncbi:nucleotide-binding domain-containing protein [Cylindrobasidium torrendii FP15055 ss-10]|uniref:Nucleotide-binding domain-containing protein n=1 Tax=Cylindrobasidium torrendii FP15055 ss-10 TaxID=1314674 RepID=A0A0D7B1A1_9AGAR|nr:nucleotide-binding domain-containing protein [Cylindrobasidium torrendii FP15055 ss-10]
MSSAEQVKKINVLGAGVIGLTTALKLQEKGGYAVTILAEVLPSDPKTVKYTSLWAGAHHVSHADGEPTQEKIDRETFEEFWKLSEPGGAAEKCFLRLDQTEYYDTIRDDKKPDPLSWMPEFKYVEPDLLPKAPKIAYGVNFKTVTIDTPVYCNYLLSRFLAAGGQIVRAHVWDIKQVIEGGPSIFTGASTPQPPDAIIVCTGLGSRFLGGIEDKKCFPMRGQICMLRAPWIRFGRTYSTKAGLWTYIIPRRSGDVVIGGTKLDDDWYPAARPETAEDILKRAFELCPELAPPEVRATREPTIEDVKSVLISNGCGLRPAREGGIRLDVVWHELKDRKIPVVSNYGHGGMGFQSSWGTASIAVELLEGAFREA